MAEKLEQKQVAHVAHLARLELGETEMTEYTKQLSAILAYVNQLNEVDTTDIEPLAQVTGLVNVLPVRPIRLQLRAELRGAEARQAQGNLSDSRRLAEDEPGADSVTADEFLTGAPAAVAPHLKVKAVLQEQ